MSKKVIDANADIDRADNARGEATLGDSSRRRTAGAKAFMVLVVVFGVLLCAFLIWQAFHKQQVEATAAKTHQIDTIATPMTPLATPQLATAPAQAVTAGNMNSPLEAPAPIVPVASNAAPATGANGQPKLTPAQVLMNRRLSAGFGAGDSGNAAGAVASAVEPKRGGAAQPAGAEPMRDLLRPVHLEGFSAGRFGSENYMLLQGAIIPCALVNRVDSSLPGMVTCDITRDVYSSNGKTVLLDRGTQVTGLYRNGLQNGQDRLFIMWSRAVTPEGVVIDLDSPGTDQLGASGIAGKVDTHFWKRFGTAMMLSVLEDAGQYAVATQSGTSGNAFVFGNTQSTGQQLANTALMHDINIPPTVLVRHGSRISIYVARDLDFSGIYGLKPTQAADTTAGAQP